MTKAGSILRAIVSDIEAVNYQDVADTPIDRILQRISKLDLPGREYFERYMLYKWRMNHKPSTLKSSFVAVSSFLTFYGDIGKSHLQEKEDERYKHYYPTKFAKKISEKRAGTDVKQIIRDSILDIVKKQKEATPEERHSILLLWYFLSLKERGIEPDEHHFQLTKDKRNSNFPGIRLSFAESLAYFLFGDNEDEAIQFLNEWEKLM